MSDEIKENMTEEKEEKNSYDLSKFTKKIQLDYINTYTSFYDNKAPLREYLPSTSIIEEIYDNWTKCFKMKDESDFDKYINNDEILESQNINLKHVIKVPINPNKIHDLSNFFPEIINGRFHYGNINIKQVNESFQNHNFTNSFKFLDKQLNVNKQLSVGILDIPKFLGYILYSRTKFNPDISIDYFNSNILKTQINKDVVRQATYINDELINSEFSKLESIPPYFYANILNLKLLGLIDNLLDIDDDDDKYELMNTFSISTIQHIISWYTDNLIRIILDSNEINTTKDAELVIDFDIPLNDEYYDNGTDSKYHKMYIDKQKQSVIIVAYYRILCMSMIDPITRKYFGHSYYVIEFNILTNTVILKYVCMDYDYISHNKFVDEMLNVKNEQSSMNRNNIEQKQVENQLTKYQQFKETISENKTSAMAGTLLTLGALSAIPIALLLGGKRTKRRLVKEKRRKNKTHRKIKKQRRTRNKKYKNKHRTTTRR